MLRTTARIILWIGATLIVAIGAIAIGNDRSDTGHVYGDDAVARTCSGAASNRQLEDALFNARALSNSGTDPICAPLDRDDDFEGVMLSHSPSSRAGVTAFGFFGDEPRRR